jgi:ribosome-binding factor A
MKAFTRGDRVKHLLQQEISRILQADVKDPRVKFVTVTDVQLTPDLREAKVLVTTLDQGEERESVLLGLKRATSYVRGEVGRRLKLRFTPTIEFVFDEWYEKQARILSLIDQLHEEQQVASEE